MAGIDQYFHGEGGVASGLTWVADETLSLLLHLNDNPYRAGARDSGADIGIDPAIRPGDPVRYLRLDRFTGVWLRESDADTPGHAAALHRIAGSRRHIREYGDLDCDRPAGAARWLAALEEATGIPVHAGPLAPAATALPPPRDMTIFLSHSGKNSLPARNLCAHLREEARVQVWFDLEHRHEAPADPAEIPQWLDRQIAAADAFVLLLTDASTTSDMVLSEIQSAVARARTSGHRYPLVILNLGGVPIPEALREGAVEIPCRGLSPGEMLEELYAALDGRPRRSPPNGALRPGQQRPAWERERLARELDSTGGRARSLTVRGSGWNLEWRLEWDEEVRSEGEPRVERRVVEGRAADLPEHRPVDWAPADSPPCPVVDFGIRPGDRIGGFVHRDQWQVWMRSDDLSVTPDDVLDGYRTRALAPPTSASLRSGALGLVALAIGGGAALFVALRLLHVPPPPFLPTLGPDDRALLRNTIRLLFGVNAAGFGLLAAATLFHPLQLRGRSGREAARYLARATAAVAWDATVLPLLVGAGVLLGYGVLAGLIATVASLVGGLAGLGPIPWLDPARPEFLAWVGGLVVGYAVVVVYFCVRCWRVSRTPPPRIESPEFRFLP